MINPKAWNNIYEDSKEYYPHLKTLIIDDIEIDKITKFVSKTRKEEQVYQIITVVSIIVGAIAFVPGQMGPAGIYVCRALEAYMAFEIAKTVGGEITFLPSRDYEVDDHLADVSKAKKILNWEYKTKVIPWLEDYLKKNL